MKKRIIYTFTTTVFLFPAILWASPYPECDVRPLPPSHKKVNYEYNQNVSLDTDFVIRMSGNFTSMYYYYSKKQQTESQWLSSKTESNKSEYQYLGGNASLSLLIFSPHFGVGVEQAIGAAYPYSGSPAHLYGASYLVLGARFFVWPRSILMMSIESGVVYSLKNDDDINHRIFVSTRYGVAVKVDFDWTVYLIPDFGIGLHFAPGIAFPDNSIFWMLDGGLHFTVKY